MAEITLNKKSGDHMKRRLGIDIDGTVTSPSAFLPYLNKHFNKKLTIEDITEYELSAALGINKEEFWKWMQEHEGNIYQAAELAINAKVTLTQWKKEHELYYISARPAEYGEITKKWFHKYEIPYDYIELIGKHDKLASVREHNIELFFEDKHDNACNIAEDCHIPVILMDTPYNRDPVHQFVYRVNNWNEAKQTAEDILGKALNIETKINSKI
ncbi:5' nucleotidase, NT5C type [Evansella clarkii]|uniref:5' nucleotidase, NT5C type n=1 Tax=Evansella clarkii TaxID=79879 RepID=UPI001FD55B94|nr:hypothetical protein [Evansella clarkii]